MPTETGADGVVRGTITGISAAPVGFTDTQLARRYRFTIIVNVSFNDVKAARSAVGEPGGELLGRVRAGQPPPASALDADAFLGQERAAVDRMSTDFARTVVSAILEAF